ncbi:pilus assembly protein, partial [Citrobacter braakii]
AERLGTERGSLVVIDFSEPQRVPAAELAQRAALALPQSAIVALGRAADAAAALAALRAGVREFIDTEAPPADALAVLARLVQAPAAPRVIQGTVV